MKRRFETLADSNLEPIPTPTRLQFKRLRYQLLPALIFVVSLSLTAYLWKSYAGTWHGTGEVSSTMVRIAATQDGRIAEGSAYPRLYDHVEKGQLLARLVADQPLELIAPVSGMVTAIKHQPGEFVNKGQEVLTITQDGGSYIVSYIRPGSSIIPKKNMKVSVRGQDHHKWAECRVQEVGMRAVPIPANQLINAKRPEWGIPVRIDLPEADELVLRPGESVMLNFREEKQ
jgi:hypothetical protein